MKINIPLEKTKEILNEICNSLRKYMDEEDLNLEQTIQGRMEENNKKLLEVIKYLIKSNEK